MTQGFRRDARLFFDYFLIIDSLIMLVYIEQNYTGEIPRWVMNLVSKNKLKSVPSNAGRSLDGDSSSTEESPPTAKAYHTQRD